ncbi:MAG: site-2 protease family protein [Eubacteriales bacterium]|nr:site-2 protease family protein [Eubacteriales bacterium]
MRRNNIDISFFVIIAVLAFSSIRSGEFSDPKLWLLNKLLLVPAVIIGISMHEFAHGFVAYKLGDNTPKFQDRVTINPLAHIDWMGLAALFFCGFGWGKPVQINPYNFKNRRRDEVLVGLAGVTMNLIIAALFAVVAKVLIMSAGTEFFVSTTIGEGIWTMLIYIIQINLVLMIFNLIPCPPLDGFNIIANIAGFAETETYWKIYQYGNWILVAIIIFGITGMVIYPCVNFFMNIFWSFVI